MLKSPKSTVAIAGLCLLMAKGSSFAEVATFEQVQERCSEIGVPGGMADCYLDTEEALGVELAAAYNRLRRCYNEPTSGELVSSQKAWLTYQEKTCKLEEAAMEFEGPSIARREYAGCLLRSTIARLLELQGLLNVADCAE